MWRFKCLTVMVCLLIGSTALASPVPVGSGSNSANVIVEFKDGATYEFSVAFNNTTTGLGLFDVIEAQTTLTTDRKSFGFGEFIDGISYAGHSNSGFGGGEDYWHYWVFDQDTNQWISSSVGASDRTVGDTDRDAWIYGSSAAPVPEPAGLCFLSTAAVGLMVRIRRVSNH